MPELADRKSCTGCTACAGICPRQCIAMVADENGFPYPVIQNSRDCVDCGLCERVCPVRSQRKPGDHLPQAYAAYSKDEALRMSSSSGGIFSELASLVLAQGGAVYGAAYDKDYRVCHRCIEDPRELPMLRGAKYAQSDLADAFPQIRARLTHGQQVLFSGTPCQVAGLKAYLKEDYGHLICVDFICHGVPSPAAWESFVRYRALQDAGGALPVSIDLRSKETGWSRYRYCNQFCYEDGSKYTRLSGESLYMKLFVGDYISRPCCESCRFKGYSRVSDFTLGDFWGVWDILPQMDDDRGTSVILVQSDKGRRLWEALGPGIVSQSITLEESSRQNPSMLVSSRAKENGAAVLELIREGRFEACEALFTPRKNTLPRRIKRKLRAMFHPK